jgi:hypothetical protein
MPIDWAVCDLDIHESPDNAFYVLIMTIDNEAFYAATTPAARAIELCPASVRCGTL